MTIAPLASSAQITIGRTETGNVRMIVTDSTQPSAPAVSMNFNKEGAKWMATELLRAAGVEVVEKGVPIQPVAEAMDATDAESSA